MISRRAVYVIGAGLLSLMVGGLLVVLIRVVDTMFGYVML